MKPETEIRNLKREVKRLRTLLAEWTKFEVRLRNVTVERDEWKRRFDLLLAKRVEK